MMAPVIIFAFDRAVHLQRTIEALQKNIGADMTEVFVFVDVSDEPEHAVGVGEVRNYLSAFEKIHGFKSLHIEYANAHRGLANSVIYGVSKVIKKYGQAIVVEDDLVTSSDFLDYMNQALQYYKNEENIWSISGYSFPMKSLKMYPHDIFYSYRGCSWGWATWENRWDTVDWEVKNFSAFLMDKKWQKRFNRGGSDLTFLLCKQMEGERDSWAIRWCFSQSNQEKYTVYPCKSKVKNIGCDGTGTHCDVSDEYNTNLYDDMKPTEFEKIQLDRKVCREFYLKYSDTVWKKIKRTLFYKR